MKSIQHLHTSSNVDLFCLFAGSGSSSRTSAVMRMPLSTSLNAHNLNSFSAVNITGRMNLLSNEWPVIYDNNKVKHVALVVVFLCLLSNLPYSIVEKKTLPCSPKDVSKLSLQLTEKVHHRPSSNFPTVSNVTVFKKAKFPITSFSSQTSRTWTQRRAASLLCDTMDVQYENLSNHDFYQKYQHVYFFIYTFILMAYFYPQN